MAQVENIEKLFSVAEWLSLEREADVRHEFYYGKLLPMAGESKRANAIAKNILKLIDDRLFEQGFDLFTHDVKAEVVPGAIYRYPDLVVAPTVDDEDAFIVKHPVLMVEVVSKDSGNRDRVKKRKEYLQIPSLWYYLIVDQDEILLELHSRNEDGRWEPQYFTEVSEMVELPKLKLQVPVGEVYRRVLPEN